MNTNNKKFEPQERRKPVRLEDGRDEFNLAEFPLTFLGRRIPEGVKTIEHQDSIVDKSTGETVNRKVIVSGSDSYGLPTAADADVLVGLIQLSKSGNNFSSRDVYFSRYEFVKLLGWRDEGKSYRRLEEALNRWVGVTLYFSAWRDKETETWRTEKFHILDNVSLVPLNARRALQKRGQGELTLSSFTWNKLIFKNLQAGYVGPLDAETYFSLESAIARRSYRFLGKHFRLRQQRTLVFNLKEFAFEKIGISRSYNVGQIKRELDPALAELESIGFLESLNREGRYEKVGRNWTIRLTQMDKALPLSISSLQDQETQALELPSLVTALVERGVTKIRAAELVGQHSVERIASKIEVFDWLSGKKDRRVEKSPAGYLVTSIQEDYAVPKGFVSKAEHQQREGARQVKERQAAEELRRKREQEEIEKAEREKVAAYWETLTPQEQTELQAVADAQADREMLAAELIPSLQRMGKKNRRDAAIRRILNLTPANTD